MQGNTEEKEKCLEKLTQMQKFIPFLDFMIDKIKRKNNEIPLECQLSKFQLLRSMIVEKSGKYTWDVIVKVEDVIEKLISKLDFKEQYEKSKEHLVKSDVQSNKTSMATSVSRVPSSTAGVSITTTSNTQATEGDLKRQEIPNTTVDLLMKTIKRSVEGSANSNTDRDKELLSDPLGPNQPLEVSGKIMETDLDKDLDGFDLTDCSNLSETDSRKTAVGPVSEVPEITLSRGAELLASSREKLLKSSQSRLAQCRTSFPPSQSPASDKPEKASESQISSAFSQINPGVQKSKSDVSNCGEHNSTEKNKKVDALGKSTVKHLPVVAKSTKPVSLLEKSRPESANSSGDVTSKQKLRERLSTDICEVYKVGKSVGGSLRHLKESSKDSKKNLIVEEVKLLKADPASEKPSSVSQSKSPTSQKKDGHGDKSHREPSQDEKRGERHQSEERSRERLSSSGSNDKSEKRRSDGKTSKSESGQSPEVKKSSDESAEGDEKKAEEGKSFELDKLNDDELLEFVKENMQSLPHLAKLKPSELRKAVQSSLSSSSMAIDDDAMTEISDDSFQDLDEFVSEESNKVDQAGETKDIHPLASFKASQVGPDGVAKNVRGIVELSKDTKHLDEVGDSTNDLDDISLDEEDYAMKLIEETTPKNPCNSKKGLLELPMPITEDLFEDISSIESFEPPSSPSENKEPKLAKTKSENKKKLKSSSKPETKSEASKASSSLSSSSSQATMILPSQQSNNHVGTNQPKDSNQNTSRNASTNIQKNSSQPSSSHAATAQPKEPSQSTGSSLATNLKNLNQSSGNQPATIQPKDPSQCTSSNSATNRPKNPNQSSSNIGATTQPKDPTQFSSTHIATTQSKDPSQCTSSIAATNHPKNPNQSSSNLGATTQPKDPSQLSSTHIATTQSKDSSQSTSSNAATNHPKSPNPPSCSNAVTNLPKNPNQSSSNPSATNLPKNTSQLPSSHAITNLTKNPNQPANPPMDSNKTPRTGQARLDPRLNKVPAILNPNTSQYPQLIRFPIEMNPSSYPKPPVKLHINDPRRHSYPSSEPKSYAEYKRLKQEKLSHREQMWRENPKSALPCGSNTSDSSRIQVEKEVDRNTSKKISDYKNSFRRQNSRKTSCPRNYQPRKDPSLSKPGRYSSLEENWDEDEKRHTTESEELVSPLEELYRSESKAKTGRGYGIQNFKIPKKGGKSVSQSPLKPNKGQPHNIAKNDGKGDIWENWDNQPPNTSLKNDKRTNRSVWENWDNEPTTSVKNNGKTNNSTWENWDAPSNNSKNNGTSEPYVWENWENWDDDDTTKEPEKAESSQTNADESNDTSEKSQPNALGSVASENVSSNEKAKSSADCKKTDSSISENDSPGCDTADSSETTGKSNAENSAPESPAIDKTDALQETSTSKVVAEEEKVSNETESVTKSKAQTVEGESLTTNEQIAEKDITSEKATPVPKEEITQEFVEALIRKSFQSGEGKLLLAQVKLFEELARKLNSKKLKTIQKIINSESGSSSSSSEDSSEDEKRKKKSKKSEQKSKRRKKKGKKSRKNKSSSSSSTSESGDLEEEDESEKKEEKTSSKNSESSASSESVDTVSTSEESKSKAKELSPAPKTAKKRRRNPEFGKNFSKKKAKRKQKQKKLLEEILSEPQTEGTNESSSPTEVRAKNKTRPKAKVKTELDRLHDDIRSMFISAGVVTATGKRMCRILKQSGGNMNNLDIVKESARMVEEEKLKKGQCRTSPRNSRATHAGGSESRSRSQSLDKGSKVQHENDEEQDPKLKLDPYVYLQRVDLDNFGYGVKISDDCISFRRMQGRNTAIRSTGVRISQTSENRSPSSNVFLARNKRKYERLKASKRKKAYVGKKLMDVVKNLPLKMAKMKHLQIYEKKEGTNKKKKNPPEKLSKKSGDLKKVDLSNSELMTYALEKKRRTYLCKLCSRVTRYITSHYQEAHPEHEVLISRLSLQEAKSAKIEAEKYQCDSIERKRGEEAKRKRKRLPHHPVTYSCRMCYFSKVDDVKGFASHVSSHTGEARYRCPEEKCYILMHSQEDLKFHILTKHPKNRYEFYNKIVENYKLTVEDEKLFGYLCSACHFVQIYRRNLESHISRQHGSSEGAKILKINMSKKTRRNRKKNLKSDSKETSNNVGNEEEKCKPVESETGKNFEVQKLTWGNNVSTKVETTQRKRQRSEEESSGGESGGELVESKKIFLEENSEVLEFKRKPSEDSRDPLDDHYENEEVDVEDMKNIPEKEYVDGDNFCNDMEDCVDLKSISALKGSDIISSVESSDSCEFPRSNSPKSAPPSCKLKVGPLVALLSGNAGVLYECYVKGCLFSTRVFDLFEKHMKISHCKTKWNGICDICCAKTETSSRGEENSFRLLTALKHLKLHEREINGGGKLTAEDLIMELKLLNPSEDTNDGESDNVEGEGKQTGETKIQSQREFKTENSDAPVKPLLRVRNLLGDRLSTPKIEETDVVSLNEDSNSTQSSTDSSKMFTIENVRSLTETAGGDSDIKIEQVCSLKDLMTKPKQQLATGNTIIVRSCPTRKIAIRPEPSAVSVDVGHINVVQPPVVAHPVVLSPISATSPIRIISTALSPVSKFAVKPIVVSTEAVRLSAPNLMPVIRPSLSVSPATATATLIPVTATTEIKTAPLKTLPQEDESGGGENTTGTTSSVEVEVITSPTRSKSPTTPSATVHHYPKNSTSDDEEEDDREIGPIQRLATSPSTGKKSVKDAKIYQEMLTKTKLCHLFKCMGIECSFTCNNESVFTQHIGLHEAQRRLRRDKGIRTIYLRSANKTTRAFYWQQCAYCCEVLSTTNQALSMHILEEHGHCMYQCAFCFYRAVSHCYVEIHQNLAHSQLLKTTPRLIYKCKPLKTPPPQLVALEKHGRKQSVRPYHCDQCGRKFYITQEFTNHLATEHQSVTAYTCHICKNLCFKINRLINHYKLHSYSTYQCAYCLHGTETENEMIFHLCNFHFSQPAVMYVRALAEGQSDDEKLKPNKKKKQVSNQLDSLKVIVYESDPPNQSNTRYDDCVVDAEAEEEDIPDNVSESSLDLSSIVAELGIYTDPQSSTGVTSLMKELASIGDKGGKNLTVKTLLPNAQFSSENENGAENCSVLISSGLSLPSDSNSERDMNIPLGQLPLEAVNVQRKEPTSPTLVPSDPAPPDKNLKLNEIIVNLQQKDKALVLAEEEDVDEPSVVPPTAVHKLPPVVVGTGSVLKSTYKSVLKKKLEENTESTESEKVVSNDGKTPAGSDKSEDASKSKGDAENSRQNSTDKGNSVSGDQPLITNVVSLSKSNTNTSAALKPPVIRVEDFQIEEGIGSPSLESTENVPVVERRESTKDMNKEEDRPSSPDIIILGNKAKDIETVTLDSDDEKDQEKPESSSKEVSTGKVTIRKEMELLRNQIANETDSLLLDESEGEKPVQDLSLNTETIAENDEKEKTLLSPIEEAICSLNKKLRSETQEALKKGGEKEESVEDSPAKSDSDQPDRRRTRFGARDRNRSGGEGTDKSDGDEGKKEELGKGKRFKEELSGKELFICGNEKCNFAADDDSSLKDHLYVCDLSRESSVLLCPHCCRQIKQFHAYLEHLKYHGEKKFHCGLCEFSSAVDTSVSRHVKQKHKCSVIKILPKESKEGHLAYYPKNYKVEKVDFEVNGYSPGDEDKLPLQSVYQVNVKCAKCPYFTKVRSNMVRHLKIHVKSVETEGVVVVPSTAPTNPVPCLETKERMFDKMTNLAASSQLAQAKEKVAIESLSPEEEAKLPQFVTEQMRYKCCLPDCNYITVDDGMLKHHIKALHDEINYYSCPHCRSTVHVDVRHVTLDKIGFHLKHHDAKLYKCAHCIFFHYQKNVVEKHTVEKHPERRYFVHTVREPKVEAPSEEDSRSSEAKAKVWKCALCDDFQSMSKSTLMDHLSKSHNTKSKYKCQLCTMKGNNFQAFSNHFSSKHPGEKVQYVKVCYSDNAPSNYLESGNSSGADSSNEHFDTTPLWQRGAPRVRHIRGILIEEEEIKTKKSKRTSVCESEAESSELANVNLNENNFYCPLCMNKKKPFYTRNEEFFRTHLYQELNYQQFACILCGKMFVDKKDFEKHHARVHADKPQALKQTKEDHEIKFWVDQVIAKQRKEMVERKRKVSESEASGSQGPQKKKKEG